MADEKTTHSCTNCGAPVLARRPSKTGTHWCKAVLCVRAKATYYNNQRVKSATQEAREAQIELNQRIDDATDFALALNRGVRVRCSVCDLPDALPGMPHPNQFGQRCSGTEGERPAAVQPRLIFAVWPDRRVVGP